MTGEEFKAIRNRLGLSRAQMAQALGYYNGRGTVLARQMESFEKGYFIPTRTARLAIMFDRFGVPDDFNAAWKKVA